MSTESVLRYKNVRIEQTGIKHKWRNYHSKWKSYIWNHIWKDTDYNISIEIIGHIKIEQECIVHIYILQTHL